YRLLLLRERNLQIETEGRSAAFMQDHVVDLVDNPFLVDSRGAGTPGEHARAAARGQRCFRIYFVDQASYPEQIISEAVLIETRPVVPERPIGAGQRLRIFDR